MYVKTGSRKIFSFVNNAKYNPTLYGGSRLQEPTNPKPLRASPMAFRTFRCNLRYPFNGLLLVIYATSFYFPFAFEMDGFHTAPPHRPGRFPRRRDYVLPCMRTNYSREAFLRKDFVLENKLKYEPRDDEHSH